QFLSGVLCFGGLRSLLIYLPRCKKVCWNLIYARGSSSTGKKNDNPTACTNIDFIYVGILIAVDFSAGNSVSECRASHDNGQSHSEQDFHASNVEINAPGSPSQNEFRKPSSLPSPTSKVDTSSKQVMGIDPSICGSRPS